MTGHGAGRLLGPGRYGLDALEPGDRIETGAVKVTGDLIDAFAALSGDRFAIHMDDAAAQAKGFPGRVAHGLLVLALVDGLKNTAPAQFDAIASLSWNWRFQKPVLIGDRIEVAIIVLSKRRTRSGDRGVLELDFVVTNARDQIVQSGINHLMVHR